MDGVSVDQFAAFVDDDTLAIRSALLNTSSCSTQIAPSRTFVNRDLTLRGLSLTPEDVEALQSRPLHHELLVTGLASRLYTFKSPPTGADSPSLFFSLSAEHSGSRTPAATKLLSALRHDFGRFEEQRTGRDAAKHPEAFVRLAGTDATSTVHEDDVRLRIDQAGVLRADPAACRAAEALLSELSAVLVAIKARDDEFRRLAETAVHVEVRGLRRLFDLAQREVARDAAADAMRLLRAEILRAGGQMARPDFHQV